jgi:hypothetical protein
MPAIRSQVSIAISLCSMRFCMLRGFLGAFGSGAAFALEDGWILARAIEHTRAHERPLREALEIFDEIRSPYYLRM